eukprot:GGOE01023684.1.p1 GENE.GGOE01023684.1~~GGOE01023684.1.p1  ORF type:complete len:184 (+),score=35.34 GGOE01023684.1:74-625(+)
MPEHVLIVHRGQTHEFPIALQCTVGDLKELVVARMFEDRLKEDIRVVFRGKLWSDDSRTLADIGVENGSRVMVVAGRAPGALGSTQASRVGQWVTWLSTKTAAILSAHTMRRMKGVVMGGPALVYDFLRTMFTDDGLVEGPGIARTGIAVPGPYDHPGRNAGGRVSRCAGGGCNPDRLRRGDT